MTMNRQIQYPNRSILSYRSGSCLLASKIIKKYQKRHCPIMKDSYTQHIIWLAYLKFLDTFGQQLREHVVNNRITTVSSNDIKFVYKSKMRNFLG